MYCRACDTCYKRRLLTSIVGIPAVERELIVAGDSEDGGQRQLRVRVGRDVAHRGVAYELHHHTNVLAHAGEHQRALAVENSNEIVIVLDRANAETGRTL